MASSKTGVCNLTSDLLSTDIVTDIENPTTALESLYERWYDQSRKKLLRSYTWNFARKRIILAADSSTPAFGYTAQFTLPSDCVRVLYVSTDLTTDTETVMDTVYYSVENGKILVTDAYGDLTQLRIVYIYDIQDVSKFDPMFTDLLASEIAVNVAYKVAESNTVIERVLSVHKDRLAEAKAVIGQENPPKRVQRSRALSARKGLASNTTTHRINFD